MGRVRLMVAIWWRGRGRIGRRIASVIVGRVDYFTVSFAIAIAIVAGAGTITTRSRRMPPGRRAVCIYCPNT